MGDYKGDFEVEAAWALHLNIDSVPVSALVFLNPVNQDGKSNLK
jgi:hypothetical protein